MNLEEADRYKKEGNEHFGMNHFAEAYESYTKAINVSPSNPNNYIYYCNRGTASFHLKNYEDNFSFFHRRPGCRPKYQILPSAVLITCGYFPSFCKI